MSKILIEGGKVIIEGHANDLETCNTLTNLCDELSTSDKFRTVKYESGYGEFESVSENDEKKFAQDVGAVTLYIKSNDGSSTLFSSMFTGGMTITTTGVSWFSNGMNHEYNYTGSKVFLGLSNTPNATVAKYSYGTVVPDEYDAVNDFTLYIVEEDPGYQVNLKSNDSTTTLAQNSTVDSVVVTSTGAQLKCGDTVNATYTYAGSKLFAGLATSANAIAPKYKPGDTIKITAETTLYIVENIIIPEHHSSLTELFTNIATVIREKTGDTDLIVADDFPDVIRDRLQAKSLVSASLTAQSGVSYTNGLNGLEADAISLFSAAISNNSDITNETSVVYLDNGDIHRKVSVGDQVTLSLNGTNYAFDIIGFNHDTLTTAAAYGANTATGKAGITFQMHDLFDTAYPMNSSNTNSGGWKNSAMRTSTMATMKGYLPAAWQTAIKPVNKVSGTGGGSSSGTETVSDSCFLLAEIEIFGSTTYSVSGEGTQYAYYKAGNSKVKNKDGSTYYWWERSPFSGNSDMFCFVNRGGNANGNDANYSSGVAFGFCV